MTGRIMAIGFLLYSLLLLAVGASMHWYFTRPTPQDQVHETVTPQIRQADDSVKAARVPIPEKSKPPAPHIIPKGSKEERRITITVKPATPKRDHVPFKPEADGQCLIPDTYVCPPVTVDLSIVRNTKGREVIASSPDGTILTAINMPFEESRKDYRNSLDVMFAGKARYSASIMRETEVLGIPMGIGGGIIRFDDETVPAATFRARF